jgi:hypothetical protein
MTTRSLLRGAAVLAALALFTTPLRAAEPPAAKPAAPAAPAGMAMPAPGPELGQLSFFPGDWTCKGRVETTFMGPAHATQSTVHIRKDYGGFWYVGRYAEKKTAANPHPMSFLFVMGYDTAGKTLTMDGFDVFGGRSHQKAPGWEEATLVFTGDSAGPGGASPARDTFTKKSASTLGHLGEIQVEGKWVRIDEETCVRAK